MSRFALCLLALLTLTVQPLRAQSRLAERPHRELFHVVKVHTLSAQTRDLAEKLEILPLLQELYKKPVASTERRAMLRSKILETVLEAYFDAASVQAEADREQGLLIAIQDMLEQRRDRAIEYNNAINFIASGTLNTIGSILGFTDSISPFPGNFNQMMSGVVSTGMSTYSLKQQSGSKAIREGSPTVLAELFGRPTNSETSFPESVWRFMHSSLHDSSGLTRAQAMERNWIQRGHLEPHNSKREKLKLDIVCGVAVNAKVMTLDDLADQISMIDDVSTVAELMTHHLRDILFSIDSDVPLEEATGDEVLEDVTPQPDKPFLELKKLDPDS
ncbi:hypothetical protein KF707_02535 [Candidatus Obscuribacterales bacterium]|nr:hypothetical protein [Candidatus Obscuribacterales bacterium]MBX3135084.1 hypothetical protein [Candidatus Obscuribacterales bacterium]MBX3150901.1 hypothetical protein [Candidatus Obscuribacterales bacterium]